MRILIIAVGVDRSEAELYAGLRRQGNDVELWTGPKTDPAPLRALGLDPQPIAIQHRLQRDAIAFFRKCLRATPPDMIYAPHNHTLSVALLAARGTKIPVIGYRGTTGHLSRWNPGAWLTYLNPHVACIVCVSEAVRRYLLSFRLPPDRLVTIHKGHDPTWYDKMSAPDRAALGIPPGTFLLGFAGNIRPVKGVDVLLRALAKLPEDSPVRLVLVGENRCRRVARLLENPSVRRRVRVLGYRKDAAAIMGLCDVVVMPSVKREGLPRAVIEAMAQGVPVIVTNVGGMPELVRDGMEGRVIPPRSVPALMEGIRYMSSESTVRQTMGLAARARIENEFHIEKTIERYSALFHSVVGDRS